MGFRQLQAMTGMGSPKLAQQAGPVGTGIGSKPMGDERTKWQEEIERQQRENGYKGGGKVSSASSRADGCVQRGKTRGKVL